jgi:hypothetical protein
MGSTTSAPKTSKHKLQRLAASTESTAQELINKTGSPGSTVVLFVLGGAGSGLDRNPALRDFPLVTPRRGQDDEAFLARVVHLVYDAIVAGGTHFLVPRAHDDWLGDHPQIANYFASHHELAASDPEIGIVFALRPPEPVKFTVEVSGWEVAPGEGVPLVARRDLVEPKVTLHLAEPTSGKLRGRVTISTDGLNTLRLRFDCTPSDRRSPKRREVVFSLARPGFLFHDLPCFEASFAEDGTVRLEFDLELKAGSTLERIRLDLVEEDNWRLHPGFPGGKSLNLPATVPAGARLSLSDISIQPVATVRHGPPYGVVQGLKPTAYRKPPGRRRDAVIFSSWVPEEGLGLGDYFIQILQRWHADSKIFVGINHGSSPQWPQRLAASGLDVTIQAAPSTMTMPCDPTGFVAALDAYRWHDEPFDLVWFGHTKGMSHLDKRRYWTGRWTIERMFWSRRAEIESYFEDPVVGLYAPHYMMMTQSHLRQTDALQRMYRSTCAPLGAFAVSTHFVMRDESVRDFCAQVDKRFFRYGPEPFGGDQFFFEMAIPNVPIMQGHEPYIEPGAGGTSGRSRMDGFESINNDWRQNNAVVAIELEKWRQDPTRFRTCHYRHVSKRR